MSGIPTLGFDAPKMPSIYDAVRQVYDGPLSMATDRMVWNITKDRITERMAVITEEAWAVRGVKPPPRREKPPTSEFTQAILDGKWDVSDVQGKAVMDYADEHGIDLKKIMEQAGGGKK